jgi:hypothetical protein
VGEELDVAAIAAKAIRAFREGKTPAALSGSRSETATVFHAVATMLFMAERRAHRPPPVDFQSQFHLALWEDEKLALCDQDAGYHFGPEGRWPSERARRLVLTETRAILREKRAPVPKTLPPPAPAPTLEQLLSACAPRDGATREESPEWTAFEDDVKRLVDDVTGRR